MKMLPETQERINEWPPVAEEGPRLELVTDEESVDLTGHLVPRTSPVQEALNEIIQGDYSDAERRAYIEGRWGTPRTTVFESMIYWSGEMVRFKMTEDDGNYTIEILEGNISLRNEDEALTFGHACIGLRTVTAQCTPTRQNILTGE